MKGQQEHNSMKVSSGGLHNCTRVCVWDVSDLGERKCDFRQWGSVRIPPRASRFAPGDSAQSLLVGKARVMLLAELKEE